MPPVPVLRFKKNSDELEFHVDNFLRVLEKVKHLPIVILSINGKKREGKSFLLNYFIPFLQNSGGDGWLPETLPKEGLFSWRPGQNRTTVGIDIWSEPLIWKTEDKRNVAIILMDCQGLFDSQTTPAQNTAIYAMSCLLSSTMIFNLKDQLDESILETIEVYSDYTSSVSGLNDQESLKPYLMFLIRDFMGGSEFGYEFGLHSKPESLPPSYDSLFRSSSQDWAGEEQQDGGNYFNRYFGNMNNIPKENREVREKIFKFYGPIEFFLMPHPGLEFLRKGNVPPNNEFQEKAEEFIRHMLDQLVIKQIGGKEATGGDLMKYVKAMSKTCSQGKLPPSKVFRAMANHFRNEQAFESAWNEFSQSIQDFFPRSDTDSIKGIQVKSRIVGWLEKPYLDVNQFEVRFMSARNNALRIFHAQRASDSDEKFNEAELEKKMEKKRGKLWRQNRSLRLNRRIKMAAAVVGGLGIGAIGAGVAILAAPVAAGGAAVATIASITAGAAGGAAAAAGGAAAAAGGAAVVGAAVVAANTKVDGDKDEGDDDGKGKD